MDVRHPRGIGASVASENDFAQLTVDHLTREVGEELAFEVLARALELARLHEVPDDASGFELFAHTALYDALREAAGANVASRVADDLSASAVDLVESGIRFVEPEPVRDPRLVVIVASDAQRSARVAARLRPHAEVRETRDVFGLLQLAETTADRTVTLLVEGNVPGFRGPTLTTLARLLPPSAEVVFWGGTPTLDAMLHVTSLPAMSTVEEVAACCLRAADRSDVAPLDAPAALVVVADADEIERTMLDALLSAEGCEVIACADGFAALEACIDHDVGLLVAAYDMPVLDGPSLASLVAGRFGPDAPPVILRASPGATREPTEGVLRVLDRADIDEIVVEARRLLPTGLLSR